MIAAGSGHRDGSDRKQLGRGVYGILLTSYGAGDRVHVDDLSSQADFVAATAHGIVWPVLASEFYLMGREEIEAGFAAVAAGNGGCVPFVAGVSQLTTRDAVRLAEAAAAAGADAVIAMAPFMKRASDGELVEHFRAIAGSGLPIVVQNAAWLGGAGTLTAGQLRELADSVPLTRHLKEEAPPLPQTISSMLAAAPGVFEHVYAGGAGRFLLDELRRGASGTMVASEWVDLAAVIFDLYERGAAVEARRLHGSLLQGINVEAAYGMAGAREVLHRRGVIRSTAGRSTGGQHMDGDAVAEIEAVLAHLADVLPWPGRSVEGVE